MKLIPVEAYEVRKIPNNFEVRRSEGQSHTDLVKFLRGRGPGALLLFSQNWIHVLYKLEGGIEMWMSVPLNL